MARGRSKPTVVNNQLHYALANGTQYIDIFRDLSAMNRKLIRQGRIAYVTDIEYSIVGASDGDIGIMNIQCLPNDWVTNNAWKKAQAVWRGQQTNTRKMIGQSAKPTWEDFKVYFDAGHRAGTILAVPSLSYGEWMYSKMVHVDDADASHDEWYLHMQGANVADTDKGLILAYQNSRATVQNPDPSLPTEYQSNMYALLAADENVAADEIAQNMEDENDQPPYDHDDYPGNDSNSVVGHFVTGMATPAFPMQKLLEVMCVPLGLLKVVHGGLNAAGGGSTAPTGFLRFRVAYGNYKGLAAPSFGQ